MKFIDEAKIYIKSGSGGAGLVSFRREKFVPKGGPNGGDGGKGGSVIFKADSNLATLLDFKYISRYIAQNGEQGGKSCKTGADGEDCIIKVPVGTLLKELETKEVLADLDYEGKEYVALKGGRGGKGNFFFRSATNQVPQKAQPGEKGYETELMLELKLIAHVGLLGFPNVGKSTFISRVSAAKPKIADYPFTTLNPNLGVVKGSDKNSFVIADIPGLIPGAHKGKGLGDKFLKHVERTKILLHILDPINKSTDNVIQDYEALRYELQEFHQDLAEKKEFIAINKIDVPLESDSQKKLKKYFKTKNKELFFISAATGEGLQNVIYKLQEEV